MGAEVTVDKHTTPLEEWLELENKLENTPYDEPPHSHLTAWKLFSDELNPQEHNFIPLDLDLNSVHQLLSPH